MSSGDGFASMTSFLIRKLSGRTEETHVDIPPPRPQVPNAFVKKSDITAWNTEHAPVLGLPAELRSRIWEETLTGRVVHIARHRVEPEEAQFRLQNHYLHWSGEREWGHYEYIHTICQDADAEDALYVASLRGGLRDESRDLHLPPRCRHTDCEAHLVRMQKALSATHASSYSKRFRKDFKDFQLPLQLLRVCRSIYQDTHLLPYSMNTFIFSSPSDFFEWSYRTMSVAQRRALCNIRLQNRLPKPVQPFQGLRDLEAKSFGGLTDLTLSIWSTCLLPGLPQNPFRNCHRLQRIRVICGEDAEGRSQAEEIERALWGDKWSPGKVWTAKPRPAKFVFST